MSNKKEVLQKKENQGIKKVILFLKCLPFIGIIFWAAISCQNTPPPNEKAIQLPNTPEAVCRIWQQYLDNNEIAKAMLLGSPAAKKWLVDNQSLFLADDELEPTKFLHIQCTEEGKKAICKYSLQEEGDIIEDYFSLVNINNQWLIHIEEQEGISPEEAAFDKMKKELELK